METIAVALSGGIDSAFSAYLLKKEGYRVIGLHADFGLTPTPALLQVKKVAHFLSLPLEVLPLQEAFQQKVIDYFVSEYQSGRTPNPCVVCNRQIKFDLLFQKALQSGAEGLASGHYARIVPCPWGDGRTIARGLDLQKDQSYFLHRLEAEKLDRILFPLGTWTKEQVRSAAREIGLPVPPQGESQDICFLPKGGYREFLFQKIGPEAFRKGDMVDLEGRLLGTHQGLPAYTIGQRRGLGLPSSAPYYVIGIDPEKNQLRLGRKKDLEKPDCRVNGFHWICRPDDLEGLALSVQIRYRHNPVRARIIGRNKAMISIQFLEAQKAVTPGQAAVLYVGDQVLGGGWIV